MKLASLLLIALVALHAARVEAAARRRWKEEGGGMHVLAAAVYGLMRHERFGAAVIS